ncbi:hypothetical protein GDO81_009242 [Engystomops pustulosus]|uniref:CWH43-like N-terminal domain-containing protein n=1 Tax=Engystomops pustulosus TaxID=76066 RepID=A0AAV7BPG9_ENGPU|nr:hypothetical protein GDO81_009242 [Engystomops pustulosus]
MAVMNHHGPYNVTCSDDNPSKGDPKTCCNLDDVLLSGDIVDLRELRSRLCVFPLTLYIGGVFFIHESFLLQHLAAICEWIFVLDILVFYGTFAYEFGSVSTDTIMAALQSSAARSCKSPGSSSTSTHLNCNPERIAMI